MTKEEAMKVLSVSTDIDFSQTVNGNTKLVSARIPLALLSKKRKNEKDTDFVIRAIESIDKVAGEEDPFLVSLTKKMIRLFVDKSMKLKLDAEEIEIVKRLYEP
jgi:AICAR transformylase/IMP cyclohydrolase PurH